MSEFETRRGRRPKEPDDLITLDEAVNAIREFLKEKYKSAAAVERLSYSKGTLYNKISSGELYRWGKFHVALVSKAEVLKLVS